MQFLSTFLVFTASFTPIVRGFWCPAAQYGECNYNGFIGGAQVRCAMACVTSPSGVQCNCPPNTMAQGNEYNYTDGGCIILGKYNGRHKCF
jgi:hypothetical protein